MWKPSLNGIRTLSEPIDSSSAGNHEAIEALLQKYGDQILQVTYILSASPSSNLFLILFLKAIPQVQPDTFMRWFRS